MWWLERIVGRRIRLDRDWWVWRLRYFWIFFASLTCSLFLSLEVAHLVTHDNKPIFFITCLVSLSSQDHMGFGSMPRCKEWSTWRRSTVEACKINGKATFWASFLLLMKQLVKIDGNTSWFLFFFFLLRKKRKREKK